MHGLGSNARIPGNKAIWVGIFCELVEFSLMFAVYFTSRLHYPEAFQAGPLKLSLLAGSLYTLCLLTSGYCAARAVHAMRQGNGCYCLRWLWACLFFGVLYPLVKAFEMRWNLANGLDANAGIFFVSYYYLTFNHLVHVVWGLLGLLYVIAMTSAGSYTQNEHGGLEAFACYWHVTDLIWLFIFPLFYVLH